jgi:hypothetical protein
MTGAYRLEIEIDEADLAAFRDGEQQVVVAKSHGNARPNVAWLTWSPSARNVVTWDETYAVYAAEIPSSQGSVPRIVALVQPAQDALLYSFNGEAFAVHGDGPTILAGHYDVRNDAPFAASIGLAQAAVVNGAPVLSPLHGVVLPPTFTADFTGGSRVYVWADSGFASGAVIAAIPREAAVVAFGAEHNAARYRYDGMTKSFRPSPGTAREER